jgi:hypothetical protein
MKLKYSGNKYKYPFVLLLFIANFIYSQDFNSFNDNHNKFSLKKKGELQSVLSQVNIKSHKLSNSDNGSGIRIGALIVVCVLNPIILLENNKFYVGTTREFTVGFSKYTTFRLSAEYSFLFRDFDRHHLRLSAKYDFALNRSKGEFISDQTVISAGAGYFIDGNGKGIFPEITAGYKIGEQLLFFPYIKLRHTFMLTKNKPDNTDLSFGAIIGIRAF